MRRCSSAGRLLSAKNSSVSGSNACFFRQNVTLTAEAATASFILGDLWGLFLLSTCRKQEISRSEAGLLKGHQS